MSSVSSGNLAVLQDPALALPISRLPRRSSQPFESVFTEFFAALEGLEGPLGKLVAAREDRIRVLARSILDAWLRGSEADVVGALASLDVGIGAVYDELAAVSRRQAAILPDQCWYRLAAWEGVTGREHVFHTPFELPHSIGRFSIPGMPSLYLANSVYLCWIECGRPKFDRCFVSRFEIESDGFEFLNLPAGSEAYLMPLEVSRLPIPGLEPRDVMNSPYADDVTEELAEYLSVWPLLASITTRRQGRTRWQQPEYVIPQCLMAWVRRSDRFLGIRYFTSKPERSDNSNDWSIDLALPTRTQKASGYCDFLRSRARWTEPKLLGEMRGLAARDLATRDAVDERERRSGRYMVEWRGSKIHYIDTAFGKMEYWLDRPECELATI